MNFIKKIYILSILSSVSFPIAQAMENSRDNIYIENSMKKVWDNFEARLSYATSKTRYGSHDLPIQLFLKHVLLAHEFKKESLIFPLMEEDEKKLQDTSKLRSQLIFKKNILKNYKDIILHTENLIQHNKACNELLDFSQRKKLETSVSEQLSQLAKDGLEDSLKNLEALEHKYNLKRDITEAEYLAPFKTLKVPYFYKEENDSVQVVPFIARTVSKNETIFLDTLFSLSPTDLTLSINNQLLTGLLTKFPKKNMIVYSMLGGDDHVRYLKIQLNKHQMQVDVYDPAFVLSSFFLTPPESEKSLAYFTKISNAIPLSLQHNYEFVGHQVFNEHDCGRFSTIYLLADLKEKKNPFSLEPTEVQSGFSYLEKEGYENFHTNPKFKWGTGEGIDLR